MPFKRGNQFGKMNIGMKRTADHVKILVEANSGSKSHLWKGGCSEWKKKQAKIRDDFTCAECGWREPEIMEADHRTPRFKGGIDEIENLVTLCPNCHRRKTNREKEGPITLKKCRGCGLQFGTYLARSSQNYCTRGCANKSPIRRLCASLALKGRVFSEETKKKIRDTKALICPKLSLKCRGCKGNFLVKPSRGPTARYCSVSCMRKFKSI